MIATKRLENIKRYILKQGKAGLIQKDYTSNVVLLAQMCSQANDDIKINQTLAALDGIQYAIVDEILKQLARRCKDYIKRHTQPEVQDVLRKRGRVIQKLIKDNTKKEPLSFDLLNIHIDGLRLFTPGQQSTAIEKDPVHRKLKTSQIVTLQAYKIVLQSIEDPLVKAFYQELDAAITAIAQGQQRAFSKHDMSVFKLKYKAHVKNAQAVERRQQINSMRKLKLMLIEFRYVKGALELEQTLEEDIVNLLENEAAPLDDKRIKSYHKIASMIMDKNPPAAIVVANKDNKKIQLRLLLKMRKQIKALEFEKIQSPEIKALYKEILVVILGLKKGSIRLLSQDNIAELQRRLQEILRELGVVAIPSQKQLRNVTIEDFIDIEQNIKEAKKACRELHDEITTLINFKNHDGLDKLREFEQVKEILTAAEVIRKKLQCLEETSFSEDEKLRRGPLSREKLKARCSIYKQDIESLKQIKHDACALSYQLDFLVKHFKGDNNSLSRKKVELDSILESYRPFFSGIIDLSSDDAQINKKHQEIMKLHREANLLFSDPRLKLSFEAKDQHSLSVIINKLQRCNISTQSVIDELQTRKSKIMELRADIVFIEKNNALKESLVIKKREILEQIIAVRDDDTIQSLPQALEPLQSDYFHKELNFFDEEAWRLANDEYRALKNLQTICKDIDNLELSVKGIRFITSTNLSSDETLMHYTKQVDLSSYGEKLSQAEDTLSRLREQKEDALIRLRYAREDYGYQRLRVLKYRVSELQQIIGLTDNPVFIQYAAQDQTPQQELREVVHSLGLYEKKIQGSELVANQKSLEVKISENKTPVKLLKIDADICSSALSDTKTKITSIISNMYKHRLEFIDGYLVKQQQFCSTLTADTSVKNVLEIALGKLSRHHAEAYRALDTFSGTRDSDNFKILQDSMKPLERDVYQIENNLLPKAKLIQNNIKSETYKAIENVLSTIEREKRRILAKYLPREIEVCIREIGKNYHSEEHIDKVQCLYNEFTRLYKGVGGDVDDAERRFQISLLSNGYQRNADLKLTEVPVKGSKIERLQNLLDKRLNALDNLKERFIPLQKSCLEATDVSAQQVIATKARRLIKNDLLSSASMSLSSGKHSRFSQFLRKCINAFKKIPEKVASDKENKAMFFASYTEKVIVNASYIADEWLNKTCRQRAPNTL